jgi:universal stress protein A
MKILLRRILVPIDFSDESHAALAYAVALVGQFGASLHLLHVIEAVVAGETLPWQLGPRAERVIESSAWDDLLGLLSPEDQRRLRAELAVEGGLPSVEIIRYAKEHAIDLIAMGTHGRTGVKNLLMGSVAENVVRQAPCPVLILHHPE